MAEASFRQACPDPHNYLISGLFCVWYDACTSPSVE
jgi:hypothetical protein